VDRDLISPGETMTLTFNLESGTYDLHMDFKVVVVKKSTASTVFDKTVGINLGSMSVPGSWSSQSIAIPLIPFELGGIPVELSIFFRLSITNNFIVTLSMYGLQQSIATLDFTSSGANAISFSKQSGVGAEVRLTDAAVMARGGITVSAGLSVVGLPTPLKIDFATVPIVDWTTHSAQNIEVAVLKTPITLEVSSSPEVVNIGETVTVSGRLIPPAAGIPLHLIVDGISVTTAESQMDGLFTLDWKPPYSGTFSIFVKASDTKYTTSATSSTIQLIVNRPPEAHFTFSPTRPVVGEHVHFVDTSEDLDGQVVAWIWDFGDGMTSTERNPVYEYSSAGTYTVKLTVIDNHGAEATCTETITVTKPTTTLGLPSDWILLGIVLAVVMVAIIAVLLFKRRSRLRA